MIMNWATLIMDDKLGGYDSGSRNPLIGWMLNTAAAHTIAMSYSLLWIVWSINSKQNRKHARWTWVNGFGVGSDGSLPVLSSVGLLLSPSALSLPSSLPPSSSFSHSPLYRL